MKQFNVRRFHRDFLLDESYKREERRVLQVLAICFAILAIVCVLSAKSAKADQIYQYCDPPIADAWYANGAVAHATRHCHVTIVTPPVYVPAPMYAPPPPEYMVGQVIGNIVGGMLAPQPNHRPYYQGPMFHPVEIGHGVDLCPGCYHPYRRW